MMKLTNFGQCKLGEWLPWEDRTYAAALKYPENFSGGPPKWAILNGLFSVQIWERQTECFGQVDHLLIRKHDGRPIHNWAHFQRIKNELYGDEALAIEVYPPESQLIDQVNCYHLFVLSRPETFEINLIKFGWHVGTRQKK